MKQKSANAAIHKGVKDLSINMNGRLIMVTASVKTPTIHKLTARWGNPYLWKQDTNEISWTCG